MGEKTLKRKDPNLVLAKIAEKGQGNGDWKLEKKKRCHLKNNNTTITTQLLLLLTPSPTPQKQKMHRENTLFLYASPTYALHGPI